MAIWGMVLYGMNFSLPGAYFEEGALASGDESGIMYRLCYVKCPALGRGIPARGSENTPLCDKGLWEEHFAAISAMEQ